METTLNEVEDELTGIPYNPESWMTDGRLYPPMDDNLYQVPGKPSMKRFRTKGHNIFISETGAIHIEKVRDGKVVFQHPDATGKGVDQ